MSTCSECMHWRSPDPPSQFDLKENKYGICRIADSDDGRPVICGSSSVSMDSSGYHAWLSTLPTFGCNRFELVKL